MHGYTTLLLTQILFTSICNRYQVCVLFSLFILDQTRSLELKQNKQLAVEYFENIGSDSKDKE